MTGQELDIQKMFTRLEGKISKIESSTERTEKALAKKAGGCGRCGYIKVGSAFFRATTFRKVCDFMDAYNSNGLHVFGPGRPAYVEAPDGSLAVIMPSAVQNYWLEDRENHLWLEF